MAGFALSTEGIPRTVDISRDTLCSGVAQVEPAITSKTFAILATHLFGSQCDMTSLRDLADSHRICVVEDSAQSIGSIQAGRKCGTWGKAGAFSFNDRKVLACGEGGCVVTDDEAMFAELRRLQLIQPTRSTIPHSLPGTYKVSEFQAAVALSQLLKLEPRLTAMEGNAEALSMALESMTGLAATRQVQPATVDRQSYFNYCFLLRDNVDASAIRSELSRRLNLRVTGPYAPLSQISDLSPARRPLDRESAKYLSASHPNCLEAFQRTCVRLPHCVLSADREIMNVVASEIASVLSDHS